MRPFPVLLSGLLVVALTPSGTCDEWKIRIHRPVGSVDFRVSEIDSISFYIDSVGVAGLVSVPHGTFIMGDGTAYCGEDQHQVVLNSDFDVGTYEVTNADYLEQLRWALENELVTVTATSVCDNLDGSNVELLDLDDDHCEIQFDPSSGAFGLRVSTYALEHAYPDGYDPANHPVKEVTWYGAARYCDWLSLRAGLPRAYAHSGDWACNGGAPYQASGYRLPTDAEWEYACQWDDERAFPWGYEMPSCAHANYDYCVDWTAPVGSYPDAPDALRLKDMAGNLWEWCNDWHTCDLGSEPCEDPVGPLTGTYRVLRGAAWNTTDDVSLRCASRHYRTQPFKSYEDVGFRIARSVGE